MAAEAFFIHGTEIAGNRSIDCANMERKKLISWIGCSSAWISSNFYSIQVNGAKYLAIFLEMKSSHSSISTVIRM